MKRKIKSLVSIKSFLGLLLLFSFIDIIAYKLTDDLPEKFIGADYYFNISVQLSISIIAAFIFYIFIDVLPSYSNRKRTKEFIRNPLFKICYTSTNLYKNILNENSTVALRKNYYNKEYFISQIETLDMTQISKNISSFFIGDCMKISLNEPIAFAVIMQIKSIMANIEKILKYRFLDSKLEELLLNMSNLGIMDLVSSINSFNDFTYKFFSKQNEQSDNEQFYYLYICSLKLQKYCYENDIFSQKQLNDLELQ